MDVAWDAEIEGLLGSTYGCASGGGVKGDVNGIVGGVARASRSGAVEVEEIVEGSDKDDIAEKLDADGATALVEGLDVVGIAAGGSGMTAGGVGWAKL